MSTESNKKKLYDTNILIHLNETGKYNPLEAWILQPAQGSTCSSAAFSEAVASVKADDSA
jgi:hypothetical protein